MRVLALHTHYQQPGGEDGVVAAEVALLRERGHRVEVLAFHNRDLEGLAPGSPRPGQRATPNRAGATSQDRVRRSAALPRALRGGLEPERRDQC